ncbi:hypothetical protein [Sporolactobacillus sp. KGMB 08714]|uniref:hypothetical protein n=1 Tax=Sporolactobacillus sp. KGMB 08714 TaxID=3064704 RepID=UPI002FBEC4BF
MQTDLSIEKSSFKDSVESDYSLIQMAGYFSYQKKIHTFIINHRDYVVIDSIHTKSSGLDAMIVENMQTGEFTIVYQGTSDGQDVKTDIEWVGN